jgi:gas vesicle protein
MIEFLVGLFVGSAIGALAMAFFAGLAGDDRP